MNNEPVICLERTDGWYKILIDGEYIGYINEQYITDNMPSSFEIGAVIGNVPKNGVPVYGNLQDFS